MEAASTLVAALRTITPTECAYVLGSCLLFPAARVVLDALLFSHIARVTIIPSSLRRSGTPPDKLQPRVLKMCESLWKLTAYGSFIVLELAALQGQEWWATTDFWSGWPHAQLTPLIKTLYGMQFGYYASTIYTLAYWEVPRKDYHVMQLHHVCTVTLILLSYLYKYCRCGVVIMLLHDINDVIMELAKNFSYARLDALSNAVLAVFVVAWAVLRIYCFPRYIIYSTVVEVEAALGFKPPYYWFMNGILVVLYCLHVYWFSLILRVAYCALTTGKGKDVREDDDDLD